MDIVCFPLPIVKTRNTLHLCLLNIKHIDVIEFSPNLHNFKDGNL